MIVQQNKIAYVTGSSRGIGLALVKKLIEAKFFVVGISRTNDFSHPNFLHESLDLLDLEAVKNYKFKHSADQVVLVNNAGMLGIVKPIGQLDSQTIQDVMTANSIAPQILINQFLNTFQSEVSLGHIVSISSGAGKHAIDAWASYCASKAAIDLFSETVWSELKSRDIKNWHVHSIAPGVVDTQMQSEIRRSKPADFLALDKFMFLKSNNELTDPTVVAKKLYQVIQSPKLFKECLMSVRDF